MPFLKFCPKSKRALLIFHSNRGYRFLSLGDIYSQRNDIYEIHKKRVNILPKKLKQIHCNNGCISRNVHYTRNFSQLISIVYNTNVCCVHHRYLLIPPVGLAFLRKSHVGCNSPPDCCWEPAFESNRNKRNRHENSCRFLLCVVYTIDITYGSNRRPSERTERTVNKRMLTHADHKLKTNCFLPFPSDECNKFHNLFLFR